MAHALPQPVLNWRDDVPDLSAGRSWARISHHDRFTGRDQVLLRARGREELQRLATELQTFWRSYDDFGKELAEENGSWRFGAIGGCVTSATRDRGIRLADGHFPVLGRTLRDFSAWVCAAAGTAGPAHDDFDEIVVWRTGGGFTIRQSGRGDVTFSTGDAALLRRVLYGIGQATSMAELLSQTGSPAQLVSVPGRHRVFDSGLIDSIELSGSDRLACRLMRGEEEVGALTLGLSSIVLLADRLA